MAVLPAEEERRRRAVLALPEGPGPVETPGFLALISREPFACRTGRSEDFAQDGVDRLLEEARGETVRAIPS